MVVFLPLPVILRVPSTCYQDANRKWANIKLFFSSLRCLHCFQVRPAMLDGEMDALRLLTRLPLKTIVDLLQ